MTKSDGCSVPYILKKRIPALQEFANKCDKTACRLHDEAYDQGGSEADRIVDDYYLFLAAWEVIGDDWAATVFDAVRIYGRSHWGTGRPWHGGDAAWEDIQAP